MYHHHHFHFHLEIRPLRTPPAKLLREKRGLWSVFLPHSLVPSTFAFFLMPWRCSEGSGERGWEYRKVLM